MQHSRWCGPLILIAWAVGHFVFRRMARPFRAASAAVALAYAAILVGALSGCGGSPSPASGLSAIPAGTADCGNGRSAPAYAVSGDGFKPETYTTDTVTPKGTYLGAVTSVGGRVSMTVNTCDGAGAYTVKLIDTEQPGNVVAASVSWTR